MMKNNIILTTCKRCGKSLHTLIKPIHSNKKIQQEFSRICKNCITPKERENMDQAFKVAIITPQQRLQLKKGLAQRTKIRRHKEDERRQHIYK